MWFIGTDRGEIIHSESATPVKCHDAAVTVIMHLQDNLLVTASLDSTVKVWRVGKSLKVNNTPVTIRFILFINLCTEIVCLC